MVHAIACSQLHQVERPDRPPLMPSLQSELANSPMVGAFDLKQPRVPSGTAAIYAAHQWLAAFRCTIQFCLHRFIL